MRNIDERELRSYLLGSLAPEQQAELDALLSHDADLHEELLAVEAEVFDQYVAGLLTDGEKELFETTLVRVEREIADKQLATHDPLLPPCGRCR